MKNLNTTVLVTGGSGFVGLHCILRLLNDGYKVKTTIRSLTKKVMIVSTLKALGTANLEKLSFIQADLSSDENWNLAATNCDFVLHVASPFPVSDPKNENELIIPARDGAIRVLKAARDAGVKRVVLTSSFAAVGYGIFPDNHVFDESDWTDASKEIPAYIKSKTLAEKAAWDFIASEGNGLELCVINPPGIFGPVLTKEYSSSIKIAIKGILDGTTSQSAEFTMGVVDVRDVADIHIRAMLNPNANGQRFIATSDGVMSFYDVAELLQKERPQLSSKIARMTPTSPEFYKEISNQKARNLLDWNPRSKEEGILASADSL